MSRIKRADPDQGVFVDNVFWLFDNNPRSCSLDFSENWKSLDLITGNPDSRMEGNYKRCGWCPGMRDVEGKFGSAGDICWLTPQESALSLQASCCVRPGNLSDKVQGAGNYCGEYKPGSATCDRVFSQIFDGSARKGILLDSDLVQMDKSWPYASTAILPIPGTSVSSMVQGAFPDQHLNDMLPEIRARQIGLLEGEFNTYFRGPRDDYARRNPDVVARACSTRMGDPICQDWCRNNPSYCEVSARAFCKNNPQSPFCGCLASTINEKLSAADPRWVPRPAKCIDVRCANSLAFKTHAEVVEDCPSICIAQTTITNSNIETDNNFINTLVCPPPAAKPSTPEPTPSPPYDPNSDVADHDNTSKIDPPTGRGTFTPPPNNDKKTTPPPPATPPATPPAAPPSALTTNWMILIIVLVIIVMLTMGLGFVMMRKTSAPSLAVQLR